MNEQEWADLKGRKLVHKEKGAGKLLSVVDGAQMRVGHYRGHKGVSLLVEWEDESQAHSWEKDIDVELAPNPKDEKPAEKTAAKAKPKTEAKKPAAKAKTGAKKSKAADKPKAEKPAADPKPETGTETPAEGAKE